MAFRPYFDLHFRNTARLKNHMNESLLLFWAWIYTPFKNVEHQGIIENCDYKEHIMACHAAILCTSTLNSSHVQVCWIAILALRCPPTRSTLTRPTPTKSTSHKINWNTYTNEQVHYTVLLLNLRMPLIILQLISWEVDLMGVDLVRSWSIGSWFSGSWFPESWFRRPNSALHVVS